MADAFGHAPSMDALIDLQKRGSYEAARQYLGSATDSAGRQLCIEVVARSVRDNDAVVRWTQDHPRDANAYVVAGVQETVIAWDKRSGVRAKYLSQKQIHGLARHLHIADELFDRALELAPNDPNIHAGRIIADMGLNRPVEISMERFRIARELDPTHWRAHRNLLMTSCEKWHGSHQLMFDIARSVDLAAPGAGNLASLIAEAHSECTLMDGESVTRAYWQSPEVARELGGAFDAGPGAPAFQADPLTPIALNYLASALWMVRDRERLRQAHEMLGKQCSERAWLYNGGRKSFDESRKWSRK
ncbi:MAG: hypothetical protein AAFX79_11375 [Planctomycetota bacterium]